MRSNGVLTIGREMKVLEEVIRQGLCYVCPIQLKSHEHDARKDHDPKVDLPYHLVLFAPCPTGRRVKTVQILPGERRQSPDRCV